MAQQNTPTTLSSYLKEVYADQIITLVPEGVKFLDLVDFIEADKEPGGHYNQPVQLTQEFGFSVGSGAFALNAAVAHQSANAQLNGTSVLLRSQISYDAAARASTSKKAFLKWSESKFIPMLSSFKKRLEILHLYGQQGLGKIATVAVANTVEVTITFATGTWSPGIWAGSEGMTVDVYSALTAGTKRTAGGLASVKSVDMPNKTIVISCTNGTDATNVAINDHLFFYGHYGVEAAGFFQMTANTATIWNVNAAIYSLWKSTQYSSSSAAVTMAKLLTATGKTFEKGCDEKLTCLIPGQAYQNVNSDLAALRRLDGSFNKKKGTNGQESIEFYGVTGALELVPSLYLKEGQCAIFPATQCKRIGATDTTMTMPGQNANELVLQVPDFAAYEMRLYTEQAFFCQRPAWCVEVNNIVST